MKNTIALFILMAVASLAPAATKKKAVPPPKAPQATTIPKDAVPNSDGTSYLYTDKQGKKWTYAKTPFGIMKSPYADPAVAAPRADSGLTKAIDKGDTVRFERPGPFGAITYEKKKTELTDDERHMLETQNAKPQ